MAKDVEYIIDDTFPDLSKFDGLTQKDLDEMIEYIESQEKERIKKTEFMTKEEKHKEFELSQKEYAKWMEAFLNERKKVTATA